MGEAEKVIDAVEKATGQTVSLSTIIAGIGIILIIALYFYNKLWPIIKGKYEASVSRRIKEKTEHDKLEAVVAKQEEHDAQFEEMIGMVKDLSANIDKLSDKLSMISGENKVSISVLLDIVECMQAKTSPEECARRAQISVNAYYREGKIPPAIIN